MDQESLKPLPDLTREYASSRLGLDVKKLFEMGNYRFVKLSKLRSWTRWKHCQDLARDEFEYNSGDLTDLEENLYFISHRWLTATHPDPDGTQLERVKHLQNDDALLFYDYCSLPQEERDATEQFVFDACLEKTQLHPPKNEGCYTRRQQLHDAILVPNGVLHLSV